MIMKLMNDLVSIDSYNFKVYEYDMTTHGNLWEFT